jgi:outer membrane protein
MSSIKHAALAALALAAAASTARAEDASKWFVHVGPAIVAPDENAKMSAGGAPLAGANVTIDSRWTIEGEVGRYITPNIAIAVAAGYPPTFKVDAAGSIAAMGTAGKMTGGPAGLLAQYHFNRNGMIQPYVGAGASFLVVFDTKDGVMSDLQAKSSIGAALQAGADVMVDDHWGAFIDVKKAWVGTIATGFMGAVPIRAKVSVDPVVGNVGVAYHF